MPQALLLLALARGFLISSPQEIMPTGITCCDEQKIRAAMAEEALARILAISESDRRRPADYLSVRAYETVRRILPAGDAGRRLEFLRGLLRGSGGGANCEEFRALVGNFVLGMTLEIGRTFQDEYDQAQISSDQAGRLVAELEKALVADREELSRAMFRAGISEREMRRLRALELRWKEVPAHAAPFEEFNLLKKNATGRPSDPDQRVVFGLAAEYDPDFPFLDEFLANYRRLAGEIRVAARRITELFAFLEELGEK